MRILFLTNFYQVHGAGGEEQSCQQVLEALQQRGHTTLVLTSMHNTNNVPVEENGIYRALYLEMDLVPLRHSIIFFTKRKAREQHNLQVLERVVQQFDPDIIYIWGMWNLPHSLAAFAESKYSDKIVYRFASYWPTLPSQHEMYWRAPGRNWYSQIIKQALGHVALAMLSRENHRTALAFKHAICVSVATRDTLVQAGIPVSNARVIYTGLDIQKYLSDDEPRSFRQEHHLDLLYAGRLAPDKGLDTVIDAMAKLVHDQGRSDIKLSIAGSGSADYEDHLRRRVQQAGLTDYVSFLGWVEPAEMPALLRKYDALLLPSVWPEPFSRAVLEGMISGLVVIAAQTGGTPEAIADEENGLLFTPADADDLAGKISRLVGDPAMRDRLGNAGKQTVIQRFTMTKMMDGIEGYLQEVAGVSPAENVSPLETVRPIQRPD